MPVIGFTITLIEGRRDKGALNSQVKISSNPKIVSIKEIDIPEIGKKAASIDFEFVTTYTPDVGSIKVSGDLLYVSSQHSKILEMWEKNKSLPNEATVEILNFLFRKCILKTLNLSDDLQLPPPINMPFITLGNGKEALPENMEPDPEKDPFESQDVDEKELQEKIKKLTSK